MRLGRRGRVERDGRVELGVDGDVGGAVGADDDEPDAARSTVERTDRPDEVRILHDQRRECRERRRAASTLTPCGVPNSCSNRAGVERRRLRQEREDAAAVVVDDDDREIDAARLERRSTRSSRGGRRCHRAGRPSARAGRARRRPRSRSVPSMPLAPRLACTWTSWRGRAYHSRSRTGIDDATISHVVARQRGQHRASDVRFGRPLLRSPSSAAIARLRELVDRAPLVEPVGLRFRATTVHRWRRSRRGGRDRATTKRARSAPPPTRRATRSRSATPAAARPARRHRAATRQRSPRGAGTRRRGSRRSALRARSVGRRGRASHTLRATGSAPAPATTSTRPSGTVTARDRGRRDRRSTEAPLGSSGRQRTGTADERIAERKVQVDRPGRLGRGQARRRAPPSGRHV